MSSYATVSDKSLANAHMQLKAASCRKITCAEHLRRLRGLAVTEAVHLRRRTLTLLQAQHERTLRARQHRRRLGRS